MKVELIEVKSGNDYKKHHALNKIRQMEEWKFGNAYVFCKGNVEQDNGIIYLPWYMMMFYKVKQIEQNQIFEADLSGLSNL